MELGSPKTMQYLVFVGGVVLVGGVSEKQGIGTCLRRQLLIF